ncbi:hypothetical protein EG829_22290 [bacterium]|nr:hypothetical protein [bacterium]
MSGMVGFMTFVFLIVVSPLLLMLIANPWSFPANVAAGWTIVAAVGTPVVWSWFRRHNET